MPARRDTRILSEAKWTEDILEGMDRSGITFTVKGTFFRNEASPLCGYFGGRIIKGPEDWLSKEVRIQIPPDTQREKLPLLEFEFPTW